MVHKKTLLGAVLVRLKSEKQFPLEGAKPQNKNTNQGLSIFPYFSIFIEQLITWIHQKADLEAKLTCYSFIMECSPREQEWGKRRRRQGKKKWEPIQENALLHRSPLAIKHNWFLDLMVPSTKRPYKEALLHRTIYADWLDLSLSKSHPVGY